jgi:hypothetical protein
VSESAIEQMVDAVMNDWDDESEPTEVPQPTLAEAEPEPVEEEAEASTTVEEPEPEPEQEDEDEEQEPEQESEEPEEDEEVEALALTFDTDDPEILAYLAQYQNDPAKALRAAAELRRAFGRQGTDLAAVRQRAQQLEEQIQRGRMLAGGTPLSEEQHAWAEGAAASAMPGTYIEQAINAGEFDLARAVCSYWARESPFEAGRAGAVIDQAESRTVQAAEAPVEASTADIVDALKDNVPGFRDWESQMVTVFNNLGPGHHLVQEARSGNVDVAMRALVNIFEIAKASSASVQEQKTEIKKRARQDSDRNKAKAAVTSGANSPGTPKETPRDVEIMPGLTWGDLETEFAANS